jgi:hypothetical protein
MKPDQPLRVIFDTATGCALLVVALALALLAGYAVAQAQAQQIVVKTGSYQLDTGDFVHWWLDEPRGLLCESIKSYEGGIGLSCLPLNATPYAWPALPE